VTESAAQAWESFALIALRLPGFVTALSSEGAVTRPGWALSLQSCPAYHCLSGRCVPSLREGERYLGFLGPRNGWRG
jgi:hypothetical protein